MIEVKKMSYNEGPELFSLILLSLLFRLGGQQTFTLAEIHHIQAEFPEIRLALSTNPEVPLDEQTITLTLRSNHIMNDRPEGL